MPSDAKKSQVTFDLQTESPTLVGDPNGQKSKIFEKSSVVFKREYLNEYVRDPAMKNALNEVVLLNYDEFFNWYNGIDENKDEDLPDDDIEYNNDDDIKDGVKDHKYFIEMAESVCQDIGREYGKRALDSVLKRPEEMDILVALTPDYQYTNLDKSARYNRYAAIRRNILGFIVIEKGECKAFDYVYCVRLICTKPVENYMPRIRGSILLGALLYCIKSNPSIAQYAMLELASGYKNLPGFFAYSKFGFEKRAELFDPLCFYEYGNLPMIVYIDDIYTNKQEIINIASGTGRLSREVLNNIDESHLVLTGIPKNTKQFNLQHKIVVTAEKYLRDEIEIMRDIKASEKYIEESKEIYQAYKERYDEELRLAREYYKKRFDGLYQLYELYDGERDEEDDPLKMFDEDIDPAKDSPHAPDYVNKKYKTLPEADTESKTKIVFSDDMYGGAKKKRRHTIKKKLTKHVKAKTIKRR